MSEEDIDRLFEKVVTKEIADKILKESDYQRAFQRVWKAKNKDKVRQYWRDYQAEYRKKNRKRIRDYMREWRKTHAQSIKDANARYRAKRKAINIDNATQ
jgi:DNA repair photolyase